MALKQTQGQKARIKAQKAKMKAQKAKMQAQKPKIKAHKAKMNTQKTKMKGQKAKMKAQKAKMKAQQGRMPPRKKGYLQGFPGNGRRTNLWKTSVEGPPRERQDAPQKERDTPKAFQDDGRGTNKTGCPPERKDTSKAFQDDRRGTNLWGTTVEGFAPLGLGYCPSIGRSGVSLCGGLQGGAPRGM